MMRMSDLTPEQRAELTFDTTLTFDDVWCSLGSEWLPEDLRALICRTRVMTQFIFLSLLYQASETVVTFEKVKEPDDYSFIWYVGALAVILFIVFFWRIRRQGQS